ncbi:hypothetical protein [Streptococcus oricebi]|uniref:TIGR04197 family type VII secretion effector n=1 Tax=Streptococcus oricebi TaxID=1547447 RepID=A0ABS5B4Y3_9STRE|nr:hypothetical protein [Streptococcus oricebi]MBP2623896.1 hypothetical protein [Streptococcus oricebi]
MSRKRITPEKMKGVKASFKAVGENLKDNASDLIDSSATESFSTATKEAKELSQTLESTVDSLDQFLNSMADEIQTMDAELARNIKYTMPHVISEADKRANAKRFAQKQVDLDKQRLP